MKSHSVTRLSALVAPLLLLSVGALTACSAFDDAPMTPPVIVSEQQIESRRRLHERNPQDWVGAAHNKSIDEFRAKLREPGILTTNLCNYVTEFSSHSRVTRNVDLATTPFDGKALRNAIADNVCVGGTRVPQQHPVESPVANAVLSSRARELVGHVTTAIQRSANSYELAEALHPVIDAADKLDGADRIAVMAVASVAQNSREYWEAELGSFQKEVEVELDACWSARKSALSDSDSPLVCLEPSTRSVPAMPPTRPGSPIPKAAASEPRVQCGPNAAWEAMKQLARKDADGAFMGILGGLTGSFMSARDPSTTLTVALRAGLAAGVAKSVYEAFWLTIDLYKCTQVDHSGKSRRR